eukprot:PhM_4_TR8023/c0_g1_i1/m.34123
MNAATPPFRRPPPPPVRQFHAGRGSMAQPLSHPIAPNIPSFRPPPKPSVGPPPQSQLLINDSKSASPEHPILRPPPKLNVCYSHEKAGPPPQSQLLINDSKSASPEHPILRPPPKLNVCYSHEKAGPPPQSPQLLLSTNASPEHRSNTSEPSPQDAISQSISPRPSLQDEQTSRQKKPSQSPSLSVTPCNKVVDRKRAMRDVIIVDRGMFVPNLEKPQNFSTVLGEPPNGRCVAKPCFASPVRRRTPVVKKALGVSTEERMPLYSSFSSTAPGTPRIRPVTPPPHRFVDPLSDRQIIVRSGPRLSKDAQNSLVSRLYTAGKRK